MSYVIYKATGYCLSSKCAKPLPEGKQYCNKACRDAYYYEARRTEQIAAVQRWREKRKAEAEGRAADEWKPQGGTLDQRINAVVTKAIRAGTCYNVAQLAPGD
jgi:hypothetical protein